jgi:hypothetical protein
MTARDVIVIKLQGFSGSVLMFSIAKDSIHNTAGEAQRPEIITLL